LEEKNLALDYIWNARGKYPARKYPWYIAESGHMIQSYLLLAEN